MTDHVDLGLARFLFAEEVGAGPLRVVPKQFRPSADYAMERPTWRAPCPLCLEAEDRRWFARSLARGRAPVSVAEAEVYTVYLRRQVVARDDRRAAVFVGRCEECGTGWVTPVYPEEASDA